MIVAASALAAWMASMLPVLAGMPWHITGAVWCGLLVAGLTACSRDPVSFLVLTYIAVLPIPLVDYLLPPRHGFVGGAPGNLAYYPADLLLIAGVALASIRGRTLRLGGPVRGFLLLGTLYLVGTLPGALVSPNPVESWMQWLTTGRALLAAVVVAGLLDGGARRATAVLMTVLVLQAMVAAAQQLHQGSLGLWLLGEAQDEQLFKYIAPGVGLWRSGGTVGHPNTFASYVLGLIPVCVVVSVARGSAARRALGVAGSAGALASLVWSYSRAAWAVVLVTVTAQALLAAGAGRRRVLPSRTMGVMASLFCAAVVVSFPAVRHRLLQTDTSATDVRVALVGVAGSMFRAYPISGVGLSQFARRVHEFDPRLSLESFRHPVHSILLLDAAEAGWGGALASLAMWGAGAVVALLQAWACARHRQFLASALWLGCLAVVLHNAFDWTLRQPAILLMFWILAALASAEQTRGAAPAAPADATPGDGA